MNTQKTPQIALEDIKISLKLKLAALWASFMFLYIYVDYFHLYMPGSIEAVSYTHLDVYKRQANNCIRGSHVYTIYSAAWVF